MSPRVRSNLIRILLAAAVIGGVAWWMHERGARGQVARDRGAEGSGSATGGASGGPRGGGAGGGSGERVVAVQIAPAETSDVPIWLEGLGTVAAFQQVTVRPQIDGRLDKVVFIEGQLIKQGELIAQIDPRPFLVKLHQAQGALARDRAQLDANRKNHERYKGLAAQNLVAQQQVEEAAAQLGQLEGSVKIDQASVEEAQLQLDYAQVRAPLAGITGVRLIDAGNLVKANDPTGLVVITAIDPAAVLFTVPQDKLPAVAAALGRGDVTVEVWNRDGSQQLATGKLAVLDNQINQTTSTLRLKALVPNPKRVLWPNAFVKARMLVETRTGALVIPAVAIQRGPAGTFVYVVGADKTAQMKPVTVGLLAGGKALIEQGLATGEQVITEGQSQLRPGSKVEPVTGKPGGGKPGGGKPDGGKPDGGKPGDGKPGDGKPDGARPGKPG